MARKGGFIGQDGLNAPDEATDVSASAGDGQVDVTFIPPSDEGGAAVTGYVATSDDGIGATGSASPITVSGLSNGTAYTFRVWALNAFGYSAPSDVSGSVTPSEPRILFAGGSDDLNTNYNTIDYSNPTTTGNATDFGDLVAGVRQLAACSNAHGGLS